MVASEVKSLANQTAKATDEIRQQIVSMQEVTTSAVSAIRNISSTIGEINDVATAIAAAVEEQGAATREIARNIQHAAGGTSEVSSNIIGVSNASTEAGAAATEVLGRLRRAAPGGRRAARRNRRVPVEHPGGVAPRFRHSGAMRNVVSGMTGSKSHAGFIPAAICFSAGAAPHVPLSR